MVYTLYLKQLRDNIYNIIVISGWKRKIRIIKEIKRNDFWKWDIMSDSHVTYVGSDVAMDMSFDQLVGNFSSSF